MFLVLRLRQKAKKIYVYDNDHSSPCEVENRQNGAREVLGGYRRHSEEGRRSCGYVATVDYEGQTIWTVETHRDNGKRHIVRAYELSTAFRELERAVYQS